MTFDEALAGAGDPELHPSIRSKYVDLLIGNACHTSMLQYWVLGINSEKINCTLLIPYTSMSVAVLFVDVGNNHSVLETLAHSFVR